LNCKRLKLSGGSTKVVEAFSVGLVANVSALMFFDFW
jgi:hypothetical protein